jgi:type II secretory pathway component PulF
METREIQIISRKEKGFSWGASVFVSVCCIFTCVTSVQFTGTFTELFKGLGVELPLATRFLIATYSWLYPLFYIGTAVLVIAKEFVLRNMRHRLVTTAVVFLAAISSVEPVQYILYLPMLDLVKKLSQAK